MVKTLAIITIGIILQISAVWFLGTHRDGGLFFCCRGVPDDIYHLALTNQLVVHFPPSEPGMTGTTVKNYHYLSSLAMADIIRIFHLPLAPTVYQYFPIFISVLLGLTTVVISQLLGLGKKIQNLWLFFLYFHGDVLYLLLFFRGKGLNFDFTIFDDATKLLAGPPRAFSILLLYTGLALFSLWIKRRNYLTGFLTALVIGSLIGFKVYTGVFGLVGMATIGCYFLWKRAWNMLLTPILTLIISLGIYVPVNGLAGGLSWNGFYRFDNFVSQPIFGLSNLELYRLAGANYLIIVFFAMYFVFLYGPTILAVFQSRKTLTLLPTELNIFLLPAAGLTAIVGIFFLQNIGGLNTVQFLINLYFVAALYLALRLSRMTFPAILLVALLALPRPLYEALGNVQMIVNRQGFFISPAELEGLQFLSRNTPADAVVALPPELAHREVSLYVSFLANRPIYVAGYTGVLQDHQVPGAKDRLEKPDFTHVDYIYIPKKYPFPVFGKTVFENQDVKIQKT